MNAVGCALGAMPCCHGAGGMAAHYRFGARRGSAVAFLGACKLALGVVFGDSLLTTLRRFPEPVLGVLLLAAARSSCARDSRGSVERSRVRIPTRTSG